MKRIHATLLLLPLIVLGIAGGVEAVDQTWSLVYEDYHPDTLRVHVMIDDVSPDLQPTFTGANVWMAYHEEELGIEIDTLTLYPFEPILLTAFNGFHFLFDLDYQDGIRNTNYGGASMSAHVAGPGTAFTLKYAYENGLGFGDRDVWMTLCSTRVGDAAKIYYYPDVPTLISPTDGSSVTDMTPYFDWSGTAGPGGSYTFEYSTTDNFSSDVVTITGLTTDSYTPPTNIEPDTIYWHVKAFDFMGRASGFQDDPFEVEILACTGKLDAPTGSANPVCTDVEYTMSWVADPYAEDYEIRENGGSWVNVGNVSQYAFTQTTAGDYSYEIRACNSDCPCSDPSDATTITVQTPLDAPTTPTIAPATVCAGDLYCVSWVLDPDADWYELQENGVWTSVGSVSQYCQTKAVGGKYVYRVRACDDVCGCSEASDSAVIDIGGGTMSAPEPTVDINPACVGEEYCLSWDAIDLATAYHVRVNGGGWLDIGDFTEYCVTASATGDFTYEVRSFSDDCGSGTTSDASDPITVTVNDVPAAPAGLICDFYEDVDSIIMSWDAVAGADFYVIYGDESVIGTIMIGTEYADTLTDGVTHAAVTAANACGESDPDTASCDFHSDVYMVDDVMPNDFRLGQNFPNPFNPETYIEFSIPRASHVSLDVFNLLGRRVITLVEGQLSAGTRVVTWNGTDESGMAVSSGIYFYKIRTDEYSETRKMVLMK